MRTRSVSSCSLCKVLLQVCKRWRDVLDANLRALIPRQWDASLLARFPYLESLDCSLCPDQVCTGTNLAFGAAAPCLRQKAFR